MNITKSATIDTVASVWIDGATFQMTGVFATVFQSFTLQSDGVILDHIYDRNFTDVELDAELKDPKFIKGFVVFKVENSTVSCPAELRRIAGKIL